MTKFYVYGLFVGDNPMPRYIGMGCGYRMNNHVRNAARELARNISPSKNLGILYAIGAGLSVTPKKIESGLDREQACELERRLIREIGRADMMKGPLWNRSDGGHGSRNPSAATRAKLSAKATAQLSSPEARRLLSLNKIGNRNAVGNRSNKGRTFTPEHRAKMRAAAFRRWERE